MKTLRILATTNDPDIAIERVFAMHEYSKTRLSWIGKLCPVYYWGQHRPHVLVFPEWWTDADLEAFGGRGEPLRIELPDYFYDSILDHVESHTVFTAAGVDDVSDQLNLESVNEPLAEIADYTGISLLLARSDGPDLRIAIEDIERAEPHLSPRAYTNVSWWANTTETAQGTSWRRVDWSVARIDLDNGHILFRRDPEAKKRGPHPTHLKAVCRHTRDWLPAEVIETEANTIKVQLPSGIVIFYCAHLDTQQQPIEPGAKAWAMPSRRIFAIPTDQGHRVFVVSTLANAESSPVPRADLMPRSSPPRYGLLHMPFNRLSDDERLEALTRLASRLASELGPQEPPDFYSTQPPDFGSAVWDVAEDSFPGNGDDWVNDYEVDEYLAEIAEELLSTGVGDYRETLSLVDFGGICFVAFEPDESDEWWFIATVDRDDTARLTALAREAYLFGKRGEGEPDLPYDGVSVNPPLDPSLFTSRTPPE